MFSQVVIGALALYLSDMFIAPYFAGSALMYFAKFLLQSWILIAVVNATSKDSGKGLLGDIFS